MKQQVRKTQHYALIVITAWRLKHTNTIIYIYVQQQIKTEPMVNNQVEKLDIVLTRVLANEDLAKALKQRMVTSRQ